MDECHRGPLKRIGPSVVVLHSAAGQRNEQIMGIITGWLQGNWVADAG